MKDSYVIFLKKTLDNNPELIDKVVSLWCSGNYTLDEIVKETNLSHGKAESILIFEDVF